MGNRMAAATQERRAPGRRGEGAIILSRAAAFGISDLEFEINRHDSVLGVSKGLKVGKSGMESSTAHFIRKIRQIRAIRG
jgi:hypothetical protein